MSQHKDYIDFIKTNDLEEIKDKVNYSGQEDSNDYPKRGYFLKILRSYT